MTSTFNSKIRSKSWIGSLHGLKIKIMVTLHTTKISKSQIKKAEKCLADNGVEKDETETVLQALGYILLDVELYPEND